jgi:UDP-N-acetyl-D-glucosamine dehydrogenase
MGDKLVVIGQGYVGLPVAMRAVEAGFDVVGLDADPVRVGQLAQGCSYVEDIGPETVRQARRTGRYLPTTDYADAADFAYAVISVPTPLREGTPDLSFVESAGRSLATHLRPGATVILESTTYPGTTEELLVPLLEAESGLTCGESFFVGYSPERIDPGNTMWDFRRTPKVVSGVGPRAAELVAAFYSRLVDTVVPVSTTREAELTKLLENTFRHVNIALVNELLVFGNQLGVNVWEAIEAAGTKPFGFMKFLPGPGVGGHCLPVDPSYLSWQVRRKSGRNFRFVELANDVNDHMPDYVVTRILTNLNRRGLVLNGANVTILGLAYKRNTSDIREAPSGHLITLLLEYGAKISAVDAHVEDRQWPATVARVGLNEEVLRASDLIVLITDHDDVDYSLLEQFHDRVLDTRNVVAGAGEVL